MKEICPEKRWADFLERKDLDLAHEIPGLARFRGNYLYNYWGQAAVFRQIPAKILSFEELKLPEALKKLCHLDQELVVVTGRPAAASRPNEKPPLTGLPLEACLVFLAHHFARHGFGTLRLDLARAAEHGVVVATLADSFMASAAGSAHDFADPLPAGLIQGFFEHISGQELGCEEIACAHLGAPECTFVITAPKRIDSIRGVIGREPAAAIIDRLCT